MKRAFVTAIAFACLNAPALAAPTCGLPLAVVEQAATGRSDLTQLNPIVAQAFLDKFNTTGPQTSYTGPVWVLDHPQDNVVEVITTSNGQGCAFVAPGSLRGVILKMIYGEAS